MKSLAAYYAFIATTSAERDAQSRRTDAARAPRPSLIARARLLLASRTTRPATTTA